MLDFINTRIFGAGLSLAVMLCGGFLTLALGGRILRPRKLLAALKESPESGMSPARAMTLALAGTLGVGNISGVASAIAIGGAGAVFWMLVSSVGACFIKYAETTLSLRHRRERDGELHGGGYYLISDLGGRLARIFAVIFALVALGASFTLGSSVQSNAISSAAGELGVDARLCAAVTVAAVGVSIMGGLERISRVTALLIVPMSCGFILMSLYVIASEPELLGRVLARIVHDAFDSSSLCGGVVGVLTSRAFSVGVTRGIVSNEAGCGTAPIAHSHSRVSAPAVQGVWGMLEVFIDTGVICALTALSVLIAEERGVELTSDGMRTAIAAYGEYVPFAAELLSVAIFVFAFATLLCWYHYGRETLTFLTQGRGGARLYTVAFLGSIALGALAEPELLWELSDLAVSLMTFINLTAVMLSFGEVKRETDNYFSKSE